MENEMKRNITLYPVFSFFIRMLIIGPVLVPFLLWKGLDYTEILLLQSISAISTMVFEVPTGAVADRLSRKLSLVISGLIVAFALLIYILAGEFWIFAIAEILFGLGLTFYSGADSAILFESLKELKREKEYQEKEGNAFSYFFIGQAVFSILSGHLYVVHPSIPFWISLGFLLSASVTALFFHEPDREREKHRYFFAIFSGVREAFKKSRIIWLLLFAGIFGSAMRLGYWLYQPYFDYVSLDIVFYGYVFAGFNLLAAFSSKYLLKKFSHIRPRHLLLTLGALLIISFVVPPLFKSKWLIIVIGLQQIFRGMYRPTVGFYVNNQIGNKSRATTISLVSFISSLGFAVISPIVGNGLDHIGTKTTYLLVGLSCTAGFVFLFFLRKHMKRRKLQKQSS